MGGAQVRRLGPVAALVVIFVVGLITAAPQAGADAGPTALSTVLCPMQVPGHPDGYSADPVPPAQWAPESGVDVPPGSVAFASPDPFPQITYTISPPGYRCNALGSYSTSSGPVPGGVRVYAPGDAVPVWNTLAYRNEFTVPLDVLCGWFPALLSWQKISGFPLGGCGHPRPVPSWEHTRLFTKTFGEAMGVVTIDAGHREPFAVTSGHTDGATVLLLTIEEASAVQGVGDGGPECAATPGYAASCRANLEQSLLSYANTEYSDATLSDVPGTLAAIRAATTPGPATDEVSLAVNPVPGTIQGNRATPSTRFHAVVSGVCRDGTAPVIAVHSDVTGNDVVPPVLTYLPDDHSQFYVGQVGAASVQARCGSRVAAHAPIDVQADAYVALGDSYASGEGDSPDSVFLPGTHGPNKQGSTGCHRSSNGWAETVAKLPSLSGQPFDFVACSGAVITDLYDANGGFYKSIGEYEPPQIFSVDSHATKLATLSIGGNNVGFSDIVQACIERSIVNLSCANKSGSTYRNAMRNIADLSHGGFDVRVGSSHELKTLSDVYVDIASRLAPHGILAVTGYPQLFSTNAKRYSTLNSQAAPPSCLLGNLITMTKANALWIDSLAVQGNKAISGQVDAANARLAQVRPDVRVVMAPYDVSFAQHRVCDKDSWINGLRISYPDFRHRGIFYQTSFHPDRHGQAAIANWVDGYVEAAQWDQAHQAAQSLAPSSTSTFSAAGFSPGEQVTATLHSMPVDLGTYRADARGVVVARVHIPTGFTPGRHTIILTGKTSRRSQVFPVTIRASGTDHLRSYVLALAGASLLAAVAAGAVYRARRRQPTLGPPRLGPSR
jgi:hypothetical protein